MKILEIVPSLSVGLWLGLIANAEVVFSASYHGGLFSLYFQRDFFTTITEEVIQDWNL